MVTLENANINILEKLVEQNKGKSYASKCNHTKCVGVRCDRCPMASKDGVGATLGDVRKELDRRMEPTESHKGGGGCTMPEWSIVVPSISKKSESLGFNPLYYPSPEDNQASIKVDESVYSPKHYAVLDDIEAIQIIARSMTVEQFKGYCLGNIMKYRLRLGAKDAVEQDLKKATNYKDIFEKFKELCHDYRAGS
ncbi:nucleotide kinase [Morganella phage vB_MmoP_MP2]|uniref:Nucleotide kinase n=1 Tax=Morganella phage vB_MmoP_MP2 TaxID=1852627 RepID=A0A192YB48_9CAUD|nr:nucleotide kinase [Morganella phage vB_MmoP_MP2]ANM46355.1 hypothetical protein MP2_gp15 [Morganella phage vB_MmoP_MP2]